jgi:Sec-independent protein translocase protein TatA
MTDPVLAELIQVIYDKEAALKDFKKMMKEIEDDIPMELEELNMQLKDLKKQAKDLKDAHIKLIIEENTEYNEYREHVQEAKEAIAEAKLKLFTEMANRSREHGDLDQTVLVQGAPFRLQTQKEVQVYLNGKVVKA